MHLRAKKQGVTPAAAQKALGPVLGGVGLEAIYLASESRFLLL